MPIRTGSIRSKVKNVISKIIPIIANTLSINLRFSVNKKSVNAISHKAIANGTNVFPIKKYIVGSNPTPLLNDTKKDKLEGHQGSDIKIQVAPTKK